MRPNPSVLLLFVLACALAQDTNTLLSEEPVVVKIDHIVVQTQDPGRLFSTMTEIFDLPAAWPIAAYPGFATGGIHAGNVNIELLKLNDTKIISQAGARIYGIVFEPTSLGENISELKNRGVDPSEPEPQYAKVNGTSIKVWTNIMLNGLFGQDYIVYLVEYAPKEASNLANRLPAAQGSLGRIGLISVKEISVGATDINKTRNAWQRFLHPAEMIAPDTWQIGGGPAVHLVRDEQDEIKSMVWGVESLDKARAFLEEKHILGISAAKELSIDPTYVEGLDIRLVEN